MPLGYKKVFYLIMGPWPFIIILRFLPSGKTNEIQIFPTIKVQDVLEGDGTNCLLIGRLGHEDPGPQKALDHSIYYQVDLVSNACGLDELLY